jgi:hypothetical protein
MIKEELYRRLRLDRPNEESGEPYPPGYCHFPKYSEEYFKQITAEKLVTKVVKRYRRTEWQKIRDGNDALDGRCYAHAAAHVAGMDRYTDAICKTIEDNIAEAAKRAGQPAAPPRNQPKPLMCPVTFPVRGRFYQRSTAAWVVARCVDHAEIDTDSHHAVRRMISSDETSWHRGGRMTILRVRVRTQAGQSDQFPSGGDSARARSDTSQSGILAN